MADSPKAQIKKAREAKKKKKEMTKTQKFFVGFAIFLFSIACAGLILAAIFVPILNNFARRIGANNFKEFYSLYKALTKYVEESQVVDYPFDRVDYLSAKANLAENGIDIFDANGNIEAGKIQDIEHPKELVLADKEVAALLENYCQNFIGDLNIPIYTDLDLALSIKEIKIKSNDVPGKYDVTFIVKINASVLIQRLGIIGGLLPKEIYLTNNITYIYDGENEKWAYETSHLAINKLSDENFNRLIKIVKTNLEEEFTGIELDKLNEFVAGLTCDGINGFCDIVDGKMQFVDGGVKVRLS